MNSVLRKAKFFCVLLPLLGFRDCAPSNSKAAPDQAALRIELRNFGYVKPKPSYASNKAISNDPHLLLQDDHTRLCFVSENVLAVYFSQKTENRSPATKSGVPPNGGPVMEAFFLNTDSGTLIARRAWDTLERQGLNDSYDTQSRILEVRDGFLVHAGTKLELYSTTLQLLKSYDLAGDGDAGSGMMWSVAVAPGGDTIHLQPSEGTSSVRHNSGFYFSGGGETEGMWLRSDTFEKLHTQMHLTGPESVSDNALVTRRRCLELQPVGESARNLCCSEDCRYGFPTFLSNKEILVTYREGFSVLSINGDELWTRRAIDYKELDWDQTRSMNGLRFAISGSSSHGATLDGVRIARPPENSILVYDTRCRKRILTATSRGDSTDFAFGLSPQGKSLAVLDGASIAVYKLKEDSCGSNP